MSDALIKFAHESECSKQKMTVWPELCTAGDWQLHHMRLPIRHFRAGFSGKPPHHLGAPAPLLPKHGSLRLLAFPKAGIAVEM